MRAFLTFSLTMAALTATPAQAAKIVIMTDPMTLERRTVVIESPGPDRVYVCAMPPAVAGCREIVPNAR